ncbi:uncharacterized protein LOC124083381 [Marmota monax]|uniref:uncharacterized protein LOC124083381 n=1 Tax=Marmota monax TaxID=9995 RepID=UPI0026EA7B92|nr:uncharacterized protein LOC124083381 [Marmota monax]
MGFPTFVPGSAESCYQSSAVFLGTLRLLDWNVKENRSNSKGCSVTAPLTSSSHWPRGEKAVSGCLLRLAGCCARTPRDPQGSSAISSSPLSADDGRPVLAHPSLTHRSLLGSACRCVGAPPRPAAPSSRAQSFPFQPPRGSSDSKPDLDTSAALHGGPAVTGALAVGSVHGRGSHWGKVPGLARPAALLPAAPRTLRIPARAAEIAPSCDRSATTGLGHLSRHSRDHGCFCLLPVVAFLPLSHIGLQMASVGSGLLKHSDADAADGAGTRQTAWGREGGGQQEEVRGRPAGPSALQSKAGLGTVPCATSGPEQEESLRCVFSTSFRPTSPQCQCGPVC